jgi:hypothetical protein
VALGGLFFPTTVLQTTDAQFMALKDPVINASGIPVDQGVFYAAMQNSSGSIALPPWTSEEFYFLPLKVVNSGSVDFEWLTATTYGFGVDISCQPPDKSQLEIFDVTPMPNTPSYTATKSFLIRSVNLCHRGKNSTLQSSYSTEISFEEYLGKQNRIGHNYTDEWMEQGKGHVYVSHVEPFSLTDCAGTFSASWIKQKQSEKEIDGKMFDLGLTLSPSRMVHLICTTGFRLGTFSVTADKHGYIRNAELTTNLSSTPIDSFISAAGHP